MSIVLFAFFIDMNYLSLIAVPVFLSAIMGVRFYNRIQSSNKEELADQSASTKYIQDGSLDSKFAY